MFLRWCSPCFVRHDLLLVWNLPNSLDWLGNHLKDLSVSTFQPSELQAHTTTPGWIWGSNSSLPCLHNKHCLLSHVSLKIALMFTTWERGGRRLLWDKGSPCTEKHSLCGDRGSWLDTLCWGSGKLWIILWLCMSYAHTTTVSTYVCLYCCVLKAPFPCSHLLLAALTIFLPSILQGSLSFGEGVWYRIKHFVVSYSLNVDQLWFC